MRTLQIQKTERVFDPFCGSGTILVHAKENGIDSIGLDVNPFYVFISRVKTYWDFDLNALAQQIKLIEEKMKKQEMEKPSAFCNRELEKVCKNIPRYIWRYFRPNVLVRLSNIKASILRIENARARDFLLLAMASVLIDVSNVHHVGETIVFNKGDADEVSVNQALRNKIYEMYSDVKAKQQLEDKGEVVVKQMNVRDLDEFISDDSVDHVITHPPYANNYNYLLHDRLPLYFLEYFKTLSDEKEFKNDILGSVTKSKAEQDFPAATIKVEEIAKRIKKTGDTARQKAVLEYFHVMKNFLGSAFRKMKRNGYCALLVGNSYVRGVMIPLDILLLDIGRKVGFEVINVSKVRDRGNGAFQHIYNGKLYESVVLLKRK